MPFVLDNSVVCGWFLENQATLRTACLRQRMTAEAAQRVIAQIVSLPIDVDRQPVPASELLALALRFGLSTYDAAYLELALRLQLPVATGDGPLRAAALALIAVRCRGRRRPPARVRRARERARPLPRTGCGSGCR